MKTIHVGDKFRLLDEVWTVIAVPLYETQFLSVTTPDQDESQDIWLDLSKADKLEWLDSEEPKIMDNPTETIDLNKLKSEIIRETLEAVADGWVSGMTNGSFASELRSKAVRYEQL